MKTVLLITFALFGLSHQLNYEKLLNDFEDTVDKVARDCYKEFNLNRATLDENLRAVDYPTDRNFKCFFECVVTHMNIFDKSGNIVESGFKKYLDVDPSIEHKIFLACKDAQGSDGCEKFYNMSLCMRKNINEAIAGNAGK